MGRLTFKTAAVAELVAHALAAPEHSATMIDFDKITLEPVYGEPKPALILVKDEGIYLMSNGTPNLMADGTLEKAGVEGERQEGTRKVVYANGFDPAAPGVDRMDVWERAREAVGGDDFGEHLPIDWFKQAVESGLPTFNLNVSKNGISFSAPQPRMKPPVWRAGDKVRTQRLKEARLNGLIGTVQVIEGKVVRVVLDTHISIPVTDSRLREAIGPMRLTNILRVSKVCLERVA